MKTNLILFLLFTISASAFSQNSDLYQCPQVDLFKFNLNNNDILEILAKVKECPTDEDIINNKVAADFDRFYGNEKQVTAYIKGYKLRGPKSIFYLARKMLGDKVTKDWKNAARNCDTVLCAFEKLLKSKNAAKQVFNFKAKSGYYLSLDQSINQGKADQIWSAKEIQELDAAADKLPKNLQKMKLKKIERYADGIRLASHAGNVAAYASPMPELMFYSNGAKGKATGPNSYTSTSWPQEVLLHELCHHHDFKNFDKSYTLISERRGSGFGKLSNWKEKTKKDGSSDWNSGKHSHFVSNYAASSPAEDYAESCMNYMLHPHKLSKKAPKKYEYMKKYVFGNKEFKQKPWADKKKGKWEKLDKLLAREDGCAQKISNCLGNIGFKYGNFGVDGAVVKSKNSTTSWFRSGKIQNLIQNDVCVKESKDKVLQEYAQLLAQTDERFCQHGGVGAITSRKDEVCKGPIDELAKKLDLAKGMDITPLVESCELKRDYTKKCIISTVLTDLKLQNSNGAKELITKMMKDKVPDRMTSLGKSLEKTNTANWLKSCLNTVKGIKHMTSISSKDNKEVDHFSYSSKSPDYSNGYIGKYISKDYKRKDINMGCADTMLASLEDDGVKIPESGSPVNLMQEHFKAEFKSFELEVLAKAPAKITKCLVFKKCKLKNIKLLIQEWASKKPDLRSGMDSDDFVQSLFEQVKPQY